jgi:hypothetical protein
MLFGKWRSGRFVLYTTATGKMFNPHRITTEHCVQQRRVEASLLQKL